MRDNPPPRFRFETVASTLEQAWQLLEEGRAPPFWVTADLQLKGRGRQQRQWHSPKGNLYSTFVVRETPGLKRSLLPFAVSVAVRTAMLRVLPPNQHRAIQLKWPNDVLAAGAKIAGILIETRQTLEGGVFAIGIGINVAEPPTDLNRPTTALKSLGCEETIDNFFNALSQEIDIKIEVLLQTPERVLPAWMSAAVGIGKPVTVHLEAEILNGTFDHLAADGALMLRQSSGAIRPIYAGDLFVTQG
ncbi:MAG: biotin--[acetyl-CoA-carboxylase] ligase [Pseudomonadota bacterium]